jgi:hypothetical protein
MASPETKTIRQIMDPEGTLPSVELVPDPDVIHPGNRPASRIVITHHGDVIGKANMERTPTPQRSHEVWLNGINVVEEHNGEPIRGQGFGMATYLAAIEAAHANGDTFRTHDLTQTQAAATIWGKFIDAGIAEVIEPFRQVSATTTTGDVVDGLFVGHAHIRPPALHAEGGVGSQAVGVSGGMAEQGVVAS